MTFFSESIGFFADKTTMHGVRNFVHADNIVMRLLWGVITVSMVILAMGYGMEVSRDYLIEGKKTTEMTYNMHVQDGGLPLPMITICPSRNPFVLSRLQDRGLSSNAAAFLLLMVDKPSNVLHLNDMNLQQQKLAAELRSNLRDNETLVDLLDFLSPSCEDMVAGCILFSHYMNGSTCCRAVFPHNYAVYYQGRCLSSRFSTLLRNHNQSRSGDYSGLSIILQEDQETFLAELDLRVSMVPIQEGNRVILNPWYQLPHEAIAEQTYIADVGAVTRLALTVTNIDSTGMYQSIWPLSKKKCDDLPGLSTLVPAASSRCYMETFRAMYEQHRNCTPLGLMETTIDGKANVTDICQPEDILQDDLDMLVVIAGRAMDQIRCRPSCQSTKLDAVIDSTPFKRGLLERSVMFGAELSAASGRNLTFSVVTVFYPNLITRYIRLSQATLMQWLSAFGGQLSLFIGASVITMLEIVAFSVRMMLMGGKMVLVALWDEGETAGRRAKEEKRAMKVEPVDNP